MQLESSDAHKEVYKVPSTDLQSTDTIELQNNEPNRLQDLNDKRNNKNKFYDNTNDNQDTDEEEGDDYKNQKNRNNKDEENNTKDKNTDESEEEDFEKYYPLDS